MIITDKKEYALSFQTNIKLDTENIKKVLNVLGNPQNDMKYIHVTGTNGKGSVCAFLEKMLISADVKTGKFTSPELVKKNEMISFCGENISDDDLNRLIEKVTNASSDADTLLSPFEIICVVMFLYFKEKECTWVILETGMGGIGDGTNVIKNTSYCVITRIGIDHTNYLGTTVSEITENKCGIIKEKSKVITLKNNGDFEVIKNKCKEKNAELFTAEILKSAGHRDMQETIVYGGEEIILSLGGENQVENASLATTVGKLMGLNEKAIIKGLKTAYNPGRFEKLKDNVYFDGAHNVSGAKALRHSLDKYMPDREKTFVMGVMKDKDFANILKILNDGHSDFIFVTVKNNPRAMDKEEMKKIACSMGINAETAEDVNKVINQETGKPIFVCGSLYLYKDIKGK